jgi:hypothetical protein
LLFITPAWWSVAGQMIFVILSDSSAVVPEDEGGSEESIFCHSPLGGIQFLSNPCPVGCAVCYPIGTAYGNTAPGPNNRSVISAKAANSIILK